MPLFTDHFGWVFDPFSFRILGELSVESLTFWIASSAAGSDWLEKVKVRLIVKADMLATVLRALWLLLWPGDSWVALWVVNHL